MRDTHIIWGCTAVVTIGLLVGVPLAIRHARGPSPVPAPTLTSVAPRSTPTVPVPATTPLAPPDDAALKNALAENQRLKAALAQQAEAAAKAPPPSPVIGAAEIREAKAAPLTDALNLLQADVESNVDPGIVDQHLSPARVAEKKIATEQEWFRTGGYHERATALIESYQGWCAIKKRLPEYMQDAKYGENYGLVEVVKAKWALVSGA